MRLVAVALALVVIGASCSGGGAPATESPRSTLPCGPTEVLTRHEHAHLTIVIRGQLRAVPANIGITATSICWLHTHDTSGIIHIEAGDDRTFTLGSFFGVWGQPLGRNVLEGERAGSGESTQTTVNQQPYADSPETIVLRDREDIVVELGPPFPTVAPYVWPPGY
ncbi:MAG TPA: hypothetical protein VGR87_01520 [Candidatus Limnocylindria bacterium]|jgi:hypothetical protein|nr:hypothetical protein [Candidatus Limnocylindria bacterium]